MAEIIINDKYVYFDDVDEPVVSRWRWTIHRGGLTYYARTAKHGISMHRLILGLPKGHVVDHINFNGLDNRRSNLRFCNSQENAWHTRGWSLSKRTHKCPYKGVWPVIKNNGKNGGRLWEAKIGINSRQKYIGMFRTAEQAAMAYDDYARYYHGRFAYLNFPLTSPKSQGVKR